jgi:hypothetical protein
MAPRRPTDSRRTPDVPLTPPAQSLRKPRPAIPPVLRAAVTPEERRAMIAEKAYLLAEGRGFAPGGETQDWLSAEIEVDALLKVSHGGSSQ